MNGPTLDQLRQSEIRAFVRANFGLLGTLRLHRSAFGADLLRAPVNILLAPILLIVRLIGFLAKLLRFRKLGFWLSCRRILLQTDVSRQISNRLLIFFAKLKKKGIGIAVSDQVMEQEIADYTGVRNALGEITTTFLILIAGFVVFETATPGLLSLTKPIAEMSAYRLAVNEFPLGQNLGEFYYGVFSPNLETWQTVGIGIALAMIASIVTTFAGVIADPLQSMTGTHQRRLSRLLNRLETGKDRSNGLAHEHIIARSADLSDIMLNIWRMIRG